MTLHFFSTVCAVFSYPGMIRVSFSFSLFLSFSVFCYFRELLIFTKIIIIIIINICFYFFMFRDVPCS